MSETNKIKSTFEGKTEKIKNVTDNKIEIFKKNRIEGESFVYIDVTSIDNVQKKIINLTRIPVNEAPSRAKYILQENDIIISTVRPNLNAIALIDAAYAGSVCSNAFCVLRLKPNHYAYYYFYYFMSPLFLDAISKNVQGTMYPAISEKFIKNFQIPLPPTVEDQISIANEIKIKLSEVKKIRNSLLCQKDVMNQIQDAFIRENIPFEDGDTLPEDWIWEKLGNVVKLKNGINFESNDVGSGILTLDVFNMYTNKITANLNNLYRVNKTVSNDFLLKENDIIFVRSSVKKEGVGWPTLFNGFSEPVTYCGFLIRARLIKPNILPQYLIYFFRKNSTRARFISASGQSTITNINQEQLRKILIPIPKKFAVQITISNKLENKILELDKIRWETNKELDAIEALDKAILRDVFSFNFGDDY